jgi:hypothetical protein
MATPDGVPRPLCLFGQLSREPKFDRGENAALTGGVCAGHWKRNLDRNIGKLVEAAAVLFERLYLGPTISRATPARAFYILGRPTVLSRAFFGIHSWP